MKKRLAGYIQLVNYVLTKSQFENQKTFLCTRCQGMTMIGIHSYFQLLKQILQKNFSNK